MMKLKNYAPLASAIALAALAAACHPKTRAVPPPPPTSTINGNANQGGKPQIEFTADPNTIDRGQSAILRWNVSSATFISIDTFGAVQATGTRSVTPYSTTTYHLTADGPGGRNTAEATVTVNPGNPTPPPNTAPTTNGGSDADRLARDVRDVFFGYDKSDIEEDARATLTRDAEALKGIIRDFPNDHFAVEGHCDERGSAEYNLALGDRRATAAKDFLVQLGVPAEKLRTISYGKERPVCTDESESCYARNRRAHIALAQ